MKRLVITTFIFLGAIAATPVSIEAQEFAQTPSLHSITNGPINSGPGLFSDTLNAKNPIQKIRDDLRQKRQRKERDKALAELQSERNSANTQEESQSTNTLTDQSSQENMNTASTAKIAFNNNNNDNKSHITNGSNNGIVKNIQQKQAFESTPQTASATDSGVDVAIPQSLSFPATFLLILMAVALIVLSLMNHGKRRKMRYRGLRA